MLSATASFGVQRPPTPTVAFMAVLRAAFSAVQSGSKGCVPQAPRSRHAAAMQDVRRIELAVLIVS